MKRKILVLMLALVMVLTMGMLAGCGDDKNGEADADANAEKDTLVVGLDDAFAPMGFRDEDGELVGFDIDLARAVGEERIEQMALTYQYLNNKIVLMVLADSDLDVTSAEQLADMKIGTQAGSSALKMLQENEAYESYKDNISEYDAYDTAIMDLKAGRVDVIAVDQVLGEYTNNNLGGEMKECTYSLGNDYYTIGCASDNTELRDKLNEALKTLIDNGTAAEISEKWFGRDIMIYEPIEGEE